MVRVQKNVSPGSASTPCDAIFAQRLAFILAHAEQFHDPHRRGTALPFLAWKATSVGQIRSMWIFDMVPLTAKENKTQNTCPIYSLNPLNRARNTSADGRYLLANRFEKMCVFYIFSKRIEMFFGKDSATERARLSLSSQDRTISECHEQFTAF